MLDWVWLLLVTRARFLVAATAAGAEPIDTTESLCPSVTPHTMPDCTQTSSLLPFLPTTPGLCRDRQPDSQGKPCDSRIPERFRVYSCEVLTETCIVLCR